MLHFSGSARRFLAATLGVVALAGCGGGTKTATHTTTSSPTATGPAVSKSAYQAAAIGVLRPMLQAINGALRSPRTPGTWQELQLKAHQAYLTIGKLAPPSDISDLHQKLVQALGGVSATAGSLFHDLSANDLQAARALGLRLVHEGQQITSLGNQLKARGYSQVGAILAGP